MTSSSSSFRHHTISESSGGSAASEMLHPGPAPAPAPAPNPSSPSSHPSISTPSRSYRFCESVYLLPTRLATVALALLQGGILDSYLTHYNSTYWFAWIAGDVAVVMMFAVAFSISYRQMMQVIRRLLASTAPGGASVGGLPAGGGTAEGCGGGGRGVCCVGGLSLLGVGSGVEAKEDGGGGLVRSPGSMPLVYFAWLVYSCVLAIRVLLIYRNFAHELTDDVFLGKNMLQMTVAASAVVFLLLLYAHHDASPDSSRRHRIDNLTYLVVFDLVDASDLLGVLSSPSARDTMETWITWCVLGVACANLILPTLPLMALSRTQFGARYLPETLQTLHRLLVLLGVNLPLLATRLLLWQHEHLPVSTFLVKNVAVSLVTLYSFYERDHHRRLVERLLQGQEMLA
ncbi:transmembrane protein 121B-like [Babylonia areolata]|uniref:transmembrane protein 121B-like n=1 Tax=Babylonia areolata TaxID=304850 RepID=UPI003FD564FF